MNYETDCRLQGHKPLTIAIDYDLTFTADPSMWRGFMALAEVRGHSIICVTGRLTPPGPDEPKIPCPVICCRDGEPKRRAAARHKIEVDIWIDDSPGMIEPSRLLDFDEPDPPRPQPASGIRDAGPAAFGGRKTRRE